MTMLKWLVLYIYASAWRTLQLRRWGVSEMESLCRCACRNTFQLSRCVCVFACVFFCRVQYILFTCSAMLRCCTTRKFRFFLCHSTGGYKVWGFSLYLTQSFWLRIRKYCKCITAMVRDWCAKREAFWLNPPDAYTLCFAWLNWDGYECICVYNLLGKKWSAPD